MSAKYPTSTSELPAEFYAILTPESTTIPGDERSRTNPGHGYPEHTVYSWNMEVFTNEEDWKAKIIELSTPGRYYHKREFRAIKCVSAKIETSIKVDVK